MRLRITLLLGAAIALAVAGVAAAAPPTNDDIANAQTYTTPGVEQPFTTIDASLEAGEADCTGEGNTVWFSFTAPSAGPWVAYTTGSDHDPILDWSENLATSEGVCNDNAADSSDATTNSKSLAAGEQEFIQVGTTTDGEWGSGSVGVIEQGNAHNNFDSARPLTFATAGAPSAVDAVQFIASESNEPGESTACGPDDLTTGSAWWTFTAPEAGTWMIESKSTTGTTLAVYSGEAVDDLTLLDCATRRRAVLVDLTAGSTYRIRITSDTPGVPVVVRAERAPVPMVASVIDSDGDGSSSAVGSSSSLAVVSGRPAVAYYDADNAQLRFAERIGGTWSDVLVDADGDGGSSDVGADNSLAVMSNGEPAVAYYDGDNGTLRFAERSGGTWSDVLVDSDGDGTSSTVGRWPSLIVLDNGTPAIAYYDRDNRELRYAERANGAWSDVVVDSDGTAGLFPSLVQHPNGNAVVAYRADNELRYAERTSGTWANTVVYSSTGSHRPSGLVFKSDGHPVTGAVEDTHQVVSIWDGAIWQTERDTADRHHAELGTCVTPKLLIDPADNVYTVWSDCLNGYGGALSVRSASGEWSVRDLVAAFEPAATEDGELDVQNTRQLGAAWLPDGRLAVTLSRSSDDSLWFFEEALRVDAGPDITAEAGDVVALQGSGSDDWGEITSFLWSGAPASCSFVDATSAATDVTCSAGAEGTVSLTATDTDGFTHTDTAALMFTAPAPEPEPEPEPAPVVAFCDGVQATIVGTEGPDIIVGTDGPDVINGLGGDDTISGLDGNDLICGGPGDDNIDGGPNADRLFGNGGHDTIKGGRGNDTIIGGRSGDILNGGPGKDLIRGNTGHDTIRGQQGKDILRGGKGRDLIFGGSGNDNIRGNRGRDTLNGGSGNDVIGGGHASDVLNGGPGTDQCKGGPGADTAAACETVTSASNAG